MIRMPSSFFQPGVDNYTCTVTATNAKGTASLARFPIGGAISCLNHSSSGRSGIKNPPWTGTMSGTTSGVVPWRAVG